MRDKKQVEMILQGDLKKVLLKMGIPTLFGMLVNALYTVVDAYFVSGLGISAFAGVSVVFPLAQIIVGIGLVFGTGGSSYASRLIGKGQKDRADRTVSTTLFGGILGGLLLIALSLVFLRPVLFVLGATEQSFDLARSYGIILLSGAVFNISSIIMANLTIAEGHVKLTMIGMMSGAILNTILDPLFIYTFSWGVEGAAFATVLAQILSNLLYAQFILRKKSYFRYSLALFRPDRIMVQEIFKIGLPSFFLQLLTGLSIGFTNYQAKIFGGDELVAAMGIMLRTMTLGTYVVFGFTKGFQPVVGANYGAAQYERVYKALRHALFWLTGFCGILGSILAFLSLPIASFFSGGEDTVALLAAKPLFLNGLLFMGFGFQCTYSQAFLALGQGREGFLLNTSRQGIFFFPLMGLLPVFFGIQGIFWAQPLADVCTILLTWIFVRKAARKLPFLHFHYRRRTEEIPVEA